MSPSLLALARFHYKNSFFLFLGKDYKNSWIYPNTTNNNDDDDNDDDDPCFAIPIYA